jgi:hypothetical protein
LKRNHPVLVAGFFLAQFYALAVLGLFYFGKRRQWPSARGRKARAIIDE